MKGTRFIEKKISGVYLNKSSLPEGALLTEKVITVRFNESTTGEPCFMTESCPVPESAGNSVDNNDFLVFGETAEPVDIVVPEQTEENSNVEDANV